MELSIFSENIVTKTFERNGGSVRLEINIDAFTPEFFRLAAKRFDERMREWTVKKTPKSRSKKKSSSAVLDAAVFLENEATALEVKRQIHAELLSSGILKGWDITENDIPVAPTLDVLLALSPALVEGMWGMCLEAAKTVKKTVGAETTQNPMTSETIETGSQEFTIPLNAQLM